MRDQDRIAALADIDDAVSRIGFRRDLRNGTAPTWRGSLTVDSLALPVTVQVGDLNFVRLPEICITDLTVLAGTRFPHVFPLSGSICYYDRNATVLDRYMPGATVLRCIARAESVLGSTFAGKAEADFAQEFDVYWGLSLFYTDLPPSFHGDAVMSYPWLDVDRPMMILHRRQQLPHILRARHREVTVKQVSEEAAFVCHVPHRLTVPDPQRWPPRNWGDLQAWIKAVAPEALAAVRLGIDKQSGDSQSVVINGNNGMFAATLTVPPAFRRPEFRQPGRMLRQMDRMSEKYSATLYSSKRFDSEFIYQRNLKSMMGNFSGKRILLLGCGTIGGFLAHQLAQCGAGSGGGKLDLCDYGCLSTENFGRHLLGVPYLNKPKAEGCHQFIQSQLPHLDVEPIVADIQNIMPRLLRCDLVIDATGEEALSLAINQYIVDHRPAVPPVLYVWLTGNGAAAQALLSVDASSACRKCVKPQLHGISRIEVLRRGVKPELLNEDGCAASLYAPFPVTASVQAAALACEMALDWANGRPQPLQRNRQLDPRRAIERRDSDVAPSLRCPACAR